MSKVAVQVKERPIIFSGESVRAILAGNKTQTRRVRKPGTGPMCPVGEAGDRLWVRESWWIHPDKKYTLTAPEYEGGQNPAHIHYKAGDPFPQHTIWVTPIFMPRWASRLTLEITSVRVERLQEITAADVQAEGITVPETCRDRGVYLLDEFYCQWAKINGKRDGCKWDDNPFVWCVTFKRVED